VELLTSGTVGTPCVVRRNTVVLPVRCESQFSDDELEAVLAHELAHVQRGDVRWLALLRAVEAVLWIQPLNRLGVTGAVVATELDCDDRALDRTGQPLGLARSVARVAEWSLARPRIQPEVAMAGEGRHLSTRVRRILAPRRPEGRAPSWKLMAAVAFALAPVSLLPSVPGAPVVRSAVMYPAELADGSGPAFMLLDAATALGELPEALEEEAAPPDGQPSSESDG
jgi:beta-lactamase regulating signal transducer with metallopeptidase domain